MQNLIIMLFILFSTNIWAFSPKNIFVRLEAKRLGHVQTGPYFQAGEVYIEAGMGIDKHESITTVIISADDQEVHYTSVRTNGATADTFEVWLNLVIGQIKKYFYNGEDKTTEVVSYKPIDAFKNVLPIKMKTIFGQQDCQTLELDSVTAFKYYLCPSTPGTGLVQIERSFRDCNGGGVLVDFVKN